MRFLRLALKILSISLVSVALIFLAPFFIHFIYDTVTPKATMLKQRSEYALLAEAESNLTGTEKIKVQKTRYKLYLWFHARGYPIDEGDGDVSIWQPWKDLIDYWRGDDGSRFFTSNTEIQT